MQAARASLLSAALLGLLEPCRQPYLGFLSYVHPAPAPSSPKPDAGKFLSMKERADEDGQIRGGEGREECPLFSARDSVYFSA